MQISDKLGQYNRNVTNGTEELRGAQGVQKLVSTVRELSAGSVFEGTVNQVRGGKVTLALGNGQVILARLDGKVDIKPGASMFFQVRSNDGSTVSIRPYTGAGNASNPILLNALTAAQIPATERTLMMVDAMMQEQMPIDRQSILDMAKLLNANPQANVQTIVQMTKLGLPVTEAMADQFEHYLTDQHALLNELDLAVGQVVEAFSDETMAPEDSFALYSKVVDIFLPEETGQAYSQAQTEGGKLSAGTESGVSQQIPVNGAAPDAGEVDRKQAVRNGADPLLVHGAEGDAAGQRDRTIGVPGGVTGQADVEVRQRNSESVFLDLSGKGIQAGTGATLGNLLSGEQLSALAKALQNVPSLVGNDELFVGGTSEEIFVDTMQDEQIGQPNLSPMEGKEAMIQQAAVNQNLTAGEFLRTLQGALAENSQYGFAGVQKLFAGKEFQTLFRDMVEQQWLIEPQDLKEEHKMNSLYEKMERQMKQLETAVKMTGTTQNSFLQTAGEVRSNIEFMNQMNQIYNYIQMPLKLSGQNANGELYVYRNKKNLNDPEAELTAFLHLDLESLGSTDVSVRMKSRQVKTNFYFEDDASYDLVEKHLPILEKRLKSKGYHCTISITNEKRNVSFKENFVKKGNVSSSGSLHRYSFDVRA